MKIHRGDITDLTAGIIIQQVNCKNVMGAGVAKAIAEKWPIVKEAYHKHCSYRCFRDHLFGTRHEVKINDDLMVINIFSQNNYGNAKKDGKKYTIEPVLLRNIEEICRKYPDRTVYAPYGIGCGLAGGNWDLILDHLLNANLDNLILLQKF